ncbi:TPA: divalent metal cation transporter, partial [Escherichia coli]
NNASQMVIILEPIAGSAAVGLFVIGIVAAGLSSQFPNLLLTPWLLADWRDTSNEVSPGYRILMTVMSLLCLVVPLFHARPVLVMIASQAFNAIILPLTVLCMFWLANKPSLMGKYRCSRWENVMFIAISVFTLIMGYMAMSGLIESLMK